MSTLVSNNIAIKTFEAVIEANFYETEGLPEDIKALFPLDRIKSCTIDNHSFTVEFTQTSSAKVQKTKSSFLNGATFKIPQIVKGKFDPKGSKLEFPDSKHALWIEKTVMYVPVYSTLSSVQYHPNNNEFTLTGLASVSVSRTDFKEVVDNYTFV